MKAKVLVLSMLMGISVVIFAQPPRAGKVMRPALGSNGEVGMPNERGPANGLNLTDAQKDAFKKGMFELQKQLQPLRNELGEAEARQRTLTTVDKPDMGAINKNIEKIGDLKTEMAKLQVKHHLDMRAQLTDEQKLKFDMFKHQMREKAGMKGHKGPKAMKGKRGPNAPMGHGMEGRIRVEGKPLPGAIGN